MTKKLYKIISIILLIALCVSMFSTVVFADEPATTMLPEETNEEEVIVNAEPLDPAPLPEPEPETTEPEPVVIPDPEPEPEIVEAVPDEVTPVEEAPMMMMKMAPTLELQPEEQKNEVVVLQKVAVEPEPEMAKVAVSDPEPEPEKEEKSEPEITYPFIVTYHFCYRGANAAWKEVSSSQKVTYEGFNNSKAVTFFSKQITNNNLQTVSDNTTIYTWLGTWTGDLGTVSDGDRVYTNTTLFQTDTDIYYYANYSEVSVAHLTANYIDNVANGSSSWHDEGTFEDYTHTFSIPADIPEHYTFLYWDKDGTHYAADASITVNASDLSGDTVYDFIATYNYQPGLKITYHMKDSDKTVTSYEAFDIYANAPIKGEWMYADDSLVPAGTIIELPDPIVVTELTEQYKEVDVYAKYYDIRWVNDDDTLLYTNEQIAYGDMPEYKGEIPTKAKTAQYTYTFNSWTPEVVPVTENATYKATYDATVNNYTVTFKNYNGAILSATQYPYGTKVAQIAVPTVTRPATAQYTYTFAGWDKMIVDVTSDATYTAMYDATINKYLITFLNYDGKVLSERYYAYGTKAANITVPVATRENTIQYTYEFAGWDRPIADVTENAVYVANYNSDLNKYTVIWVNDDNTILEIDKNVRYGVIPTFNSRTPTKAATAQYSYTFAGWTPAIVAVSGNAVYTARYTENINSYLVTFNPGTHGTFAPQMTYVPYGGATPAAPNPTGEEGWEFTGWDLPIGNIVYGNVTFTAQWKEIPPAPTPTPDKDDSIRTIEEIEEDDTPLAEFSSAWALINLIILILTILALLKINEKKYTIISPIAVIGALILFIFTENVRDPMVLVDRWTIWQLLVYIVTILSRLIAPKDDEDKEEEINNENEMDNGVS